MGKRKDDQAAYDNEESVPRKHKKHKKKHKHKRAEFDDTDSPEVTSPKTSIKLKLKIGGETLGTKNVTSIDPTSQSSFDDAQEDQIINVTDDLSWDSAAPLTPQRSSVAGSKAGDASSDEEKKWLDALEAGELDDYGEIPKARDPSLLTARQRAMLHGHQVELQQLPSGYKTVELTEEQLQRRQQRALKRRKQAHEKREKDKKQTLERLLKKQDTKTKGPKMRGSKRMNIPRVRYVNNAEGISISMPQGHPFPFPPKISEPPKQVAMCGVAGCKNPKKYACSKTNVPLCSLQCYKKNLALSQTTAASTVAAS
ncbi:hypothetical protein BaRGS_00002717 [Batillaria attramentaria]|uniref:INO80 complex subunit B-like conserved region domain-containing protein n=1 Tax=Batillaria attramentaria TaxID=370345 RepID=A0ABD0M342_9CAEN